MKKVFSLGLLIAAMVLVTFSSCKPANTVKNVTGVKLSETTKSIVVGGEFVLTATVSPTDAANKEVTWASDKANIATVDNNGKVHYTEIKVNPDNDGVNYVVTSGLKLGDRIVSKGLTTLQDGMKIKALTPAQYDEALKKAAKLGESQSSAGGFLKAMKGDDDKK